MSAAKKTEITPFMQMSFFTDGTKKYGVFESFNVGTHDWEKVTRVFKPAKPISYVRFNVLFRYHKGKIEVRNLLFKELD